MAKNSTKARGFRRRPIPAPFKRKLAKIKLFLCDVDGVLTDTSIFIGMESEIKQFNIQDGLGMRFLQKCGIKVGWISNRPSFTTSNRAAELRIDYLSQRDSNKVEAASDILQKAGVTWEETCYVGDDIVDLGLLRRAGVSVAVANAIPEAKAMADYTTRRNGGEGAVREVIELILIAQNHWPRLIEDYSK